MNQYPMQKSPAFLLLVYFQSDFVHSVAARDERVISSLKRAHCTVGDDLTSPRVQFKLGQLFDSLCLAIQASGSAVSFDNWDKEFREFCKLLFERWPDRLLADAGYRIERLHRSNRYINMQYELDRLR